MNLSRPPRAAPLLPAVSSLTLLTASLAQCACFCLPASNNHTSSGPFLARQLPSVSILLRLSSRNHLRILSFPHSYLVTFDSWIPIIRALDGFIFITIFLHCVSVLISLFVLTKVNKSDKCLRGDTRVSCFVYISVSFDSSVFLNFLRLFHSRKVFSPYSLVSEFYKLSAISLPPFIFQLCC